MSADDYRQARRATGIIRALRGTTFTGVSNRDIAEALGESASNVTRMLQVLIDEGFVQRIDAKRYTLGIALLQIAQAHADETARLTARIEETNQRLTKGD